MAPHYILDVRSVLSDSHPVGVGDGLQMEFDPNCEARPGSSLHHRPIVQSQLRCIVC